MAPGTTSEDAQNFTLTIDKKITAGIPQSSILDLILYLLYTNDISQTNGATVTTFANYSEILAVSKSEEEAAKKLQIAVYRSMHVLRSLESCWMRTNPNKYISGIS